MCLRVLSIMIAVCLFTPVAHAEDIQPATPMLDAVEPIQVKQFVQARSHDARDLALGTPAPRMVVPTNLDCATLYQRRVALMRSQVDQEPTDFMGDPRIRTGALLGTVWMPAFAYLPFRTVQRFQAQQRRPQMQADLDALRAASAAQRCFEH